jgi:hypothetical protein
MSRRRPLQDDEIDLVDTEAVVIKKTRVRSPVAIKPTYINIKTGTPRMFVGYTILKSKNLNDEHPLDNEKFDRYLRKTSDSEDGKSTVYVYFIPINASAIGIPRLTKEILKQFENNKIINSKSKPSSEEDPEIANMLNNIKNLNLNKNDEDYLIDEMNNLNVGKGFKRKSRRSRRSRSYRKSKSYRKSRKSRKIRK